MSKALDRPIDFRLILHQNLSDGYELSKVLLAKAGWDGTLELLTSAWEQVLGFGREELRGKTLSHLMWSNPRSVATAVAAILDQLHMGPVDLRVRCRNGLGKGLTLHRLYDKQESMMYIVAVESAGKAIGRRPRGQERRSVARPA